MKTARMFFADSADKHARHVDPIRSDHAAFLCPLLRDTLLQAAQKCFIQPPSKAVVAFAAPVVEYHDSISR